MRIARNPSYTTGGYTSVDPFSQGKIRFSKTEVLHITAAIAVLSLAFSFIMIRRISGVDIVVIVLLSVILVVCSFLFHEFGHKFVAQKYNAWSEFRAFPYGLIIALMMAAVAGILFAAPGAVFIQGEIDKERYGKISLAGPAVNFVIAAIAILAFLAYGTMDIIGLGLFMLAQLNAFLGLFNMIPVLPFDGAKILAWDIKVYIITAVIGAAELAVVLLYLVP